jgi:uncharacterized protein (TIGR03084 family)
MSSASMATARLMETWAHGLDVADALGVVRPATQRLRSIAHLGVRTRDYAFAVNEQTPRPEPFRVEMLAPDGSMWAWGPEDAAQRVTGSAEDFCYLVTQRRPLSSLDIVAVGDDAERWLTIAQAFAGPARPVRAATERPLVPARARVFVRDAPNGSAQTRTLLLLFWRTIDLPWAALSPTGARRGG